MTMLEINKQKMIYSLRGGIVPVYETDENGNIKTITVDGKKIPVETGEYITGYEKPVIFYASISNKLSEVLIQEFGIDNSTNFVQIVADKGTLLFNIGTLVWKQSEVKFKNGMDNVVDETSCDYIVKGVATEGLTVDLFLLQKNIK